MSKLEAVFEVAYPTKNTIRYKEVGDGPFQFENLYIQKWAAKKLNLSPVSKLKVTVEVVEDEDE